MEQLDSRELIYFTKNYRWLPLFLFYLRDSIEVDDIADGEVVLPEDHINRNATSECQTQSLQETITSGPEQNTRQKENR